MATITSPRTSLFYKRQPGGLATLEDAARTTGNRFYVDSAAANAVDSTGHGLTPDSPFATLDYAVGQCSPNQGDVIYVLPGHAETINAAAAIDLDVAGISVIGLGQGEDRPTITIGSSEDLSTVEIGAADVKLANVILQPGNDGVDILLDINADGAIVEDVELRSDEANAYQADTYVDINGGANGADRVTLRRVKISSITAGAANGVEIGAVEDALVIEDCWVDGDFSNAGVHSGSIFTNALIRGNVVRNRQTGDHAIELTAACTGVLADNRLIGDTLGTILDPGSLMCLGNLETDAIDQAGVDTPRVAAGGLPDDSITAASIATGAIDADAIADNAIDAGAIAANAITDAKIAAGAITAAKFAAGAVDAAAIAAGAIDAATFAAGAIDAAAIANAAIDAATFAAGAIDAAAIAAGAIDAATFAAGAIDAAAIAANAITDAKIAAGAITAAKFAAGAIDAAAIAAGAIDAATFAAGAIDAAAIAAGAIDAATFAAGAIDAAAIANGAIDAATFAAGAIDAAAIAAGAIDADAIANGAIDAATFAAGAIDAAAIAAGAIDAATFAAGAIDAAAIANGAIDAATFAAGAIDAAAIAADAITNAKIADNALATEQFALSAAEKTTEGVVVTRATAALPQSTSGNIFTVTGLCLLKRIVGYVTVQVGAFANATKIKINSTGAGATTDICGTLDINGAVIDTRYEITGTFANAMVATIDLPLAKVQTAEIVIPPGTIALDCAGSDGGGGRVRWSVTYVPMESGAQMVAA